MRFQRVVSSSQATLPIVCAIAFALWFLLPSTDNPQDYTAEEYGLWQCLPSFFHAAQYSLLLGLASAAIAVYMMVELKNKNLLLRVNSYMLSSTLALLLALSAPLHPLQPGSIVMLFTLYAYFPLFASYQTPHPFISFSIYLPLSIASLFFPKLLLLTPIYWLLQVYLRSFTFRSLLASLIAIIMPYWFYGGIAIITDSIPQFIAHLQSIISVPDIIAYPLFVAVPVPFSLSSFSFSIFPILILTILMLVVGVIDFQLNKLLDKTRTRSLYNVVMWHAVSLVIFISIYHCHAQTLLPLLVIDTSMLYGHFFTLTHTRFSNILNIVFLLLMAFVLVVQFV